MADALYMVFVPGSTDPPKGPWPLDEIAKRHRAGELNDAAKLCRVGEETWTPITSVLPPPVVEDAYEVTTDGEAIVGPVTLDQIRRGLVAGKLPPDSRARLKGQGDWTPVAVLIAAKRESAATEVAAPTATPTPAAARQTVPSRSRTPLLIGVGVASLAIVTAVVLGTGAGRRSSGTAATSSARASSSAANPAASDETRRLADADKATKESEERMRLLVSEDPADWKALTEKYPGSLEAKEAAEQLAKNASLCADLDQWTSLVEKETEALSKVAPSYTARNQQTKNPFVLLKIAAEMRKDASAHEDALETAKARLSKHGVSGDEEKVRSKLSSAIVDMGLIWTGFAESFQQIAGGGEEARRKSPEDNLREGLLGVTEFESRADDWAAQSYKVLRELRAACKKPDATPETSDCTQCSSQEDFDAAMKKGSKCCPVMACTSDATCSGGRVCCKIPGGQLCADASRCTGSNRVQGGASPDRDQQCRRSCPAEPDVVVNTHCYCVCMGACSD